MDGRVSAEALHAVDAGEGGLPLVLLHGFGSDCLYWRHLQCELSRHLHTLAYDLPGHGRSASIGWGRGTGGAAEAVTNDLDRRDIGRIHLCGHSLGGAVACVMALKQPERIASLTLLAPGGFGPEINARLLRRFAKAREEDELQALLEQFYGARTRVPRGLAGHLAESRRASEGGNRLLPIADCFLQGEEQGRLPVAEIAELGMPVAVIWGTQDRVTPTRHAHKLPGVIAVHVFDGVGHSIADEIPQEVMRIIRENTR